MNVYDFDNTIYKGDSSVDFYFFCVRRQPTLLFLLPRQLWAFLLYLFRIIDKTAMKQRFYCYLCKIGNIDKYLGDFTESHKDKIKDFYNNQNREDDVIISASPEFLLGGFCRELSIKYLLASQVDRETGEYDGVNCYGEEKVRRFNLKFPGEKIDKFYSDSLSDAPLANIAEESFFVRGDVCHRWDEYKPNILKKLAGHFLTREFLLFIFVGFINTFNGILFSMIFGVLLSPVLAYAVGYALSLTVSYIINSFLTFRERLSLIRFFKFCLSSLPNFLIQMLAVVVFSTMLSLRPFISYVIAAIIGFPVTFLIVKVFTFNRK